MENMFLRLAGISCWRKGFLERKKGRKKKKKRMAAILISGRFDYCRNAAVPLVFAPRNSF